MAPLLTGGGGIVSGWLDNGAGRPRAPFQGLLLAVNDVKVIRVVGLVTFGAGAVAAVGVQCAVAIAVGRRRCDGRQAGLRGRKSGEQGWEHIGDVFRDAAWS